MMRPLLLTLGSVLCSISWSQTVPHDHRTCSSHGLTQRLLQQQGLSTDLLHHLPTASSVTRGGPINIPVVVHVVWNTASENVPTATINALITELNEDYSGTNSDLGSVRPSFQGVVGNPGFQFCLAQVDPGGNATTGIVRKQTTETWFDPDNETDDMKAAPIGSQAWDPTRYLNIWICDITSGASGSTITVGYAYLPVGGVVGSSIDGLVVDYAYGTTLGARTATHEIGHYLGLLHTFDEGGSCVNSDGFSDTPTSNSPTFSCTNTNLMKCGVLTQYENFMDYSNCTVMFTDQQAAYMTNILMNERSGLLANAACSGPIGGLCIPTSTNGPNDGDFINRVALGTFNNANSGGTAAYTDYSTTYTTTLTRNAPYSITIQGGTYADGDHYAAWIDYDQDETFEASEKLGEFSTSGAGETQQIAFTVPAGATLGNTVLRVRGVYHNEGEPVPTDACYNYAFGETEDYGISIINGGGTTLCVPTSANGTVDGDYVNAVILNTIENTESGGTTAPTYSDLRTQHNTTLVRNGFYGVVVQSGSYTNDTYAVWIDFDQNGTFADGEKLGEFATTEAAVSRVIPFSVPASTPLGTTVMRVRGAYMGTGEPNPMQPCYSYAYGETEDYGITIVQAPSAYCTPFAAIGPADGDFINGVSLGTITNLNSGGTDGPRYSNLYNTHTTTVERGEAYSLIIQGGSYAPDLYTAWLDMNSNGSFEASENLGEFTTTEPNELNMIDFTVPANATVGATRLRVRGGFIGNGEPTPFDPCHSYIYGETEDYQVMIQFATQVDETNAATMALWPNPTTGQVNFRLSSDNRAEVEVIDMQGRTVLVTTINGRETTMDVSALATGTYMVRIRQNDILHHTRLEVMRP